MSRTTFWNEVEADGIPWASPLVVGQKSDSLQVGASVKGQKEGRSRSTSPEIQQSGKLGNTVILRIPAGMPGWCLVLVQPTGVPQEPSLPLDQWATGNAWTERIQTMESGNSYANV